MKKAAKYLFLINLLLVVHIAAAEPDYKTVYDDSRFLMEGIFQAREMDLNNDGLNELAVAGKNYVGRELFVYWVNFEEGLKPVVKWRSPNLFEDRSVLWITSGKFEGTAPSLLAVTDTRFYFFKYEAGSLNLNAEFTHNLEPLNLIAGDVDGDGRDELIVARVGRITNKNYLGYLQIFQLRHQGWELLAESDLLGNIRGLSAGDLNQDGKAEILVEEGLQLNSGNIHIYTLENGKFSELIKLKNAVNGAVYALKIKKFSEGIKLLTASTKGKINFFRWDGQNFQKEGMELSFNCGLVDLDAADLNGDQQPELATVGYPQRLMILSR